MRLTSIQRLFCYFTSIVLFSSGLIWLIFNVFQNYNPDYRFFSIWSLKFHGAAAYGFLVVFGMIISTHISFNWQVKKNRRKSGIILTILFVILIITGYLLYYLGDEIVRNYVSYIHWIIGIFAAVVLPIHHLKHKKSSNRSNRKNHKPRLVK